MRKFVASLGIAAALGCGAFALNTVMPANATSPSTAQDPPAASDECVGRPHILQDALDSLVADGTITADQKTAIRERVKSMAQDQPGDRPGRGPKGRIHRFIENGIEVAADTIGVSTDELKQAMKDGKSIASVAQDHGVDPQTVIDALVKAGTEKVDEALANGTINERQAQRIKDRLPDIATRFVNHTRPC